MNVNRFFKRSKIVFENFSQKYYCWKTVREENCLQVWNTEREIFHGRLNTLETFRFKNFI